MSHSDELSRRRFLALSTAAAASTSPTLRAIAQTAGPQRSLAAPPPLDIGQGIHPLFTTNTARPLRYTPVAGDFVIRNGGEFFNRPLYGRNNDFRVDAGDRPEFSLYLPGHGGNLKFGFTAPRGGRWLQDADEVVARYRPGRMIYEVRDPLLGGGAIRLELLTLTAGIIVRAEGLRLRPGVLLHWAFAGADGHKGARGGDIGCERVPVSQFFQVTEADCADNQFTLEGNRGERLKARLKAPAGELLLTFPGGARLALAPYLGWSGIAPMTGTVDYGFTTAVLTGSISLTAAPLHVAVWRARPTDVLSDADPAVLFTQRSAEIAALAAILHADTPDEYINAVAGAIGPPADFLWDSAAGVVMHGCVAWRAKYAGWRGPYCLDALGNHARAAAEYRLWTALENTTPAGPDPATGPADAGSRLARKEGLLHSNGDVSHNHYDMNMVLFDGLLRHLRWTGDLDFAREQWPAIQRHLAWEHRLFRRLYDTPAGQLPLYEAYAAIWASDNLQYNGGGAAHSSAYNVFAFRTAAVVARLLGQAAKPYEQEADLIEQAMQELLWLPRQGTFAESKDFYGPQTAYPNPALWTVYHTIDSQVPSPRQAWQMCAERLHAHGRIPVHGEGVPPGPWFLLGCSNWMPYLWSLTLILMAECAHMALAMWQAGMADDAFALFKGCLLDSMFQGLCPGDFHMTSPLDPYRQEAQRDFGDPIGITARAFVEGLFGVRPNLLENIVVWAPGFPSTWTRASLRHADFDLSWHRDGMTEEYSFTSRFPRKVPLRLVLPARTTSLPIVMCDGTPVPRSFHPGAVGRPMLAVEVHASPSAKVFIAWHGEQPVSPPPLGEYKMFEAFVPPVGVRLDQIADPQAVLQGGSVVVRGFHTVFANLKVADATWAMPISFHVDDPTRHIAVPMLAAPNRAELVDLSSILTHNLTDLFAQPYAEPRSPFCALSLPSTLLGGWADNKKEVVIDDTGLRSANGTLQTVIGVPFRTPAGTAPNCVLLSHFKPYSNAVSAALSGRATGLYLLLTGTTHPQCSRMQNGLITAFYADGTTATLSLRNPETWWPIEQDYMIDDFLFSVDAPLPPRVDLRTGRTRVLDSATFKGKGGPISGGAATILHLPLDPAKQLSHFTVETSLYPVVVSLLAATLVRG